MIPQGSLARPINILGAGNPFGFPGVRPISQRAVTNMDYPQYRENAESVFRPIISRPPSPPPLPDQLQPPPYIPEASGGKAAPAAGGSAGMEGGGEEQPME